MRVLVSGTGTGVGKTWVTRGVARALAQARAEVVALKPIETGCDPEPRDAIALARACGRPELAGASGFYRARAPLAPLAATMEGERAPDFDAIIAQARALSRGITIVEGAGGVLVPIDERRDVLDLASALAADVLLVSRDELGCLSSTLTAASSVRSRALRLLGIVLTQVGDLDESARTNAIILRERLACPVWSFACSADDDDALALAAAPIARSLLDPSER